MPATIREDDDRYGLSWGNIIPWREIRLLKVAEHLPQRRRRRGDYEASAHVWAK
jgi:hypothetical protein